MPEENIYAGAPRPSTVNGDIAAVLPAPARKKFKALRAAAERDRARRNALSDSRTVLMERTKDLSAQVRAMVLPLGQHHSDSNYPGRGLAEDHAEVRAARLQLESMREDLDEMNAAYADGAAGGLLSLVRALNEFVHRSRIFVLAPKEVPTLRKGETLRIAIENRRRRLRELAADREAVSRAPLPSTTAKQVVRKQLEELAARGRPDVFGLIERGQGKLEWPMVPEMPTTTELPRSMRVDTAALIAWALGPALVQAIEREIDEIADDERALSADQRRAKLNEIAADLLAVEREEESLIEMAEAEGLPIHRRSDADPRAVLGLAAPASAALAKAS
jgi:hypothetical protein